MLKKINFYHVAIGDLLASTAPLINTLFKAKLQILVACSDIELLTKADAKLWTFSSNVFCPHGLETDPNPELQPILFCNLDTLDKNINNANCLCLITNNLFIDSIKVQKIIDKISEITTLICIFCTPEKEIKNCLTLFNNQTIVDKKYFIDLSGKWIEYNIAN